MSDRHSGYIVVLENDVRDDDSEAWQNAIRMMKGVVSVKPIVADIQSTIAKERAKRGVVEKVYALLKDLQND